MGKFRERIFFLLDIRFSLNVLQLRSHHGVEVSFSACILQGHNKKNNPKQLFSPCLHHNTGIACIFFLSRNLQMCIQLSALEKNGHEINIGVNRAQNGHA